MELVKRLGVTTLAALHDLNLAAYYCDYLVMLKEGKVYASGKPREMLTAALIKQVFAIDSDVQLHPKTGKHHITFLPPSTRQRAGETAHD